MIFHIFAIQSKCLILLYLSPKATLFALSPQKKKKKKYVWEFWLYQIWFGLFTAPFYAYTQTMMSELIPAGHENMFFALFGIANRVSSFIGPVIIAAIINATNFEWDGFPICTILQVIPCIMIAFVSMPKAQEEKHAYEKEEKIRKAAQVEPIEERVIRAPEPTNGDITTKM